MASLILNRGQLSVNIKEFIASSAEDMNTISLTNVAPGSKCLCLDTFAEYILDADGVWKTMPAESNGANVDLTGYATEEWVNAKIALILENPSIDIDSIAELAKVLEEGGIDLAELRKAIDTLTSKVELLAQADKMLSQAIKTESIARDEADAELKTAIEETNANLAENVEAINKKIQAEVDNNAMVHNMSAEVDAKLMDDIHAVEDDLAAHKENVATIHNMQAQNDAALLTKIQKNREDITANKEAQDAVNADVTAQIEAMGADLDAETARATAADEANAAEIARVDSVLKAAIENDGAGIDSIKELAAWVEDHGEDAAAIVKSVEDETKRAQEAEADLKKENNMANSVGSRADDTYKIKRTDKGLEISFSNPEEERLNKIVLDKESIKIEQRKQVLNPPTYPAGGEVSTIINDPEYLFATIDELREDINSGGAKAQKMFNAGVLGSGRVYRECNEVPRPGGTGVKLMLDDSGNGYVDCENGAYDVTYDPNAVKIVRIGDFYLYVVYDENHFPIGLCRFGRPEGVFPEGNANHHADWEFIEVGNGIDKDIDTSRQPHSKIPFNGLDKEFVGTKAWGSDAHVFKLVQVKERYIIIYSRRGPAFWQPALNKEGIFCPKITNYEFDIQTSANDANSVTHYVLSEDYYAITVKEDTTNSPSNVLSAYDLFDVLEGRGPLVSNVDQYALPYNSMNLWGGYWPEKDDYRVGTFDPDVESYDYDNYSGVLSARKLNPAGNYNIGKLENFHPLRMQDGSEQKIRVATVKGFKTNMDWPNAAAVIPSDCALRSGAIWFQLIFAHTVSNEFKVFYRVLYDGYVKDKSDVRYPWSSCAEIATAQELSKLADQFDLTIEEIRNEIANISTSLEAEKLAQTEINNNVNQSLININNTLAKKQDKEIYYTASGEYVQFDSVIPRPDSSLVEYQIHIKIDPVVAMTSNGVYELVQNTTSCKAWAPGSDTESANEVSNIVEVRGIVPMMSEGQLDRVSHCFYRLKDSDEWIKAPSEGDFDWTAFKPVNGLRFFVIR